MLACALPGLAFAETMQVAVGVAPVEHFAKKIGGELVQTTLLVPPGADAHTYEPKPSQMRALSRVALYLSIGLEFEKAWEARLKGANPQMLMVRTDADLKKLPMPQGHEHNEHKAKTGHGHEEELDPHIWVSPAQARQMAAIIAAAFAKADPSHAKAYVMNLKTFLKEIDELDAQIKGCSPAFPQTSAASWCFILPGAILRWTMA